MPFQIIEWRKILTQRDQTFWTTSDVIQLWVYQYIDLKSIEKRLGNTTYISDKIVFTSNTWLIGWLSKQRFVTLWLKIWNGQYFSFVFYKNWSVLCLFLPNNMRSAKDKVVYISTVKPCNGKYIESVCFFFQMYACLMVSAHIIKSNCNDDCSFSPGSCWQALSSNDGVTRLFGPCSIFLWKWADSFWIELESLIVYSDEISVKKKKMTYHQSFLLGLRKCSAL